MKKSLIIFFFLVCCASADIREGFDCFNRSTAGMPRISKEIIIEADVRIHIVPDSSYMPCDPAAAGCATSGNDVYVIGYRWNGFIIVNQAILGHELNHVLHYENPEIINPDTF